MFHKKLTKRIERIERKMDEFIQETSIVPYGAALGMKLGSNLVKKNELEAIIGNHSEFECTWNQSCDQEDSCSGIEKKKTIFDYIRGLEERNTDLELKVVHLERLITKHISGNKKKKKVSKSGRK